jgi:hypothetical protein
MMQNPDWILVELSTDKNKIGVSAKTKIPADIEDVLKAVYGLISSYCENRRSHPIDSQYVDACLSKFLSSLNSVQESLDKVDHEFPDPSE